MRRIAVTGSSGFIGQNLSDALRAKGDTVVPLARPFDADRIASQLHGSDAVVHLAGKIAAVREQEFIDANVEGTRTVAEAARRAGVRLVHVSSLAAGGPAPASAPRSEDDVPAPITPYGRSKLEGERVVASTPGLRWMILRPSVVYGPRDRAMLALFRFAAAGLLPLVGRATAAYAIVHVDDVVRAIDRAIEADLHGETLSVAHPQPASTREIVETIRTAVGGRAAIVRVPDPVLRALCAAGDVVKRVGGRRILLDSWRYRELSSEGFVCRVDRLRDRLGVVAAVDLRDGFVRTAAWYRSAGWLRA